MAVAALKWLVAALLYWGIGRIAARRVGAPWRGAEGFAWAVALGTGASSLVLYGLCAARLSLTLFFVPAAMLWFIDWRLAAREARRLGEPTPRPSLDAWAWPPLAIGAFLAVSSLAVETGQDALAYHLPAAHRLAWGGAGAFPGLLDAEYRLGFDVLWSGFSSLAQETPCGTAVLHATVSAGLCAAVFAEVRRRAGSAAAGIATTLLLASSAIADYAILGFVDHAVALYGFLALSATSKALRLERGPWALLAGVLAGFAANASFSGAAWVLATAAALLAGFGVRRGWRPALVASVAASLVTLPFVLRAWIVMGNPFFPAFASSIGSGWADPRAVEHASRVVLAQTGIHRGPLLGVEGTVRAVFDPAGGFEAAPWILAFLPAAALLRGWTPARRGLVVGAFVAWAAWAWFVPVVRFGMGAWAWGAVAAAVGAARLASNARPIAVGLIVAAVALFVVDARVVWRRSAPRVAAVLSNAAPRPSTLGEEVEPGGERLRRPGAQGLSGDALAWAGTYPAVVSLSPVRNGVVSPDDLSDPDRLLAACRRLKLRSLSLAPAGRYGYADAFRRAADVWTRDGLATTETLDAYPGWLFVDLGPDVVR